MRLTILIGLCAVFFSLPCSISTSHAQGCTPADLSCNSPEGQGANSSSAEDKLTPFQTALGKKPATSGKAEDKLFYNLVIDNFCDTGGLVDAAKGYVGSSVNNLIVHETRALALTLTVSFTETSNPKKVVFPLVTLSDDVDPKADPKTDINCKPIVIAGVPRNQPLLVGASLVWTKKRAPGNAGAILTDIGNALIGVSFLGPHTATGGVTLITFAKGIDAVSQATIRFLDLIKPGETHFTQQYPIGIDVTQFAYGPKNKPFLVIRKELGDTNLKNISVSNPETIAQAFAQEYAPDPANNKPDKSLTATFNSFGDAYAVAHLTPNAQNLNTLCGRVSTEVDKAYNGDPGAIAMAIYYYLYKWQDMYAPLKATCLTTPQIKILGKIGAFAEVYPGMFKPNGPPPGDSPGVSDALWTATQDLMNRLATRLKSLPTYPDAAGTPADKDATALLTRLFASEIAVAGDGKGVKLLPRVDGLPRTELIDAIKEWGPVTHLGCYSKPKSTLAIGRKISGEGLILFPKRKLLALVQVGKSDSEATIERLEFSLADLETVTRLLGGRQDCGANEDGWNPKKDFDSYNPNVALFDPPASKINVASIASSKRHR